MEGDTKKVKIKLLTLNTDISYQKLKEVGLVSELKISATALDRYTLYVLERIFI